MDIEGKWFNELGSSMMIQVHGSTVTGKYQTAVGDADGLYELVGRVSVPADDNRTIGFVVAWQNDKRKTDSVTAWSGEVREVNGNQILTTTWLLTGETDPKDDWKSTLVGKDLFTRIEADRESVLRLKAIQRPSHHSAA
jgi:hypothetical protein